MHKIMAIGSVCKIERSMASMRRDHILERKILRHEGKTICNIPYFPFQAAALSKDDSNELLDKHTEPKIL